MQKQEETTKMFQDMKASKIKLEVVGKDLTKKLANMMEDDDGENVNEVEELKQVQRIELKLMRNRG